MCTPRNSKKPAAPRIPRKYQLFDESRTRCGYNNHKVGAPTLSSMPGTAESITENAPRAALELYADIIRAYSGHCTTCKDRCPGCYAMREKCYSDVFIKWLLNTVEMFLDPARFYALVEKELYSNEFCFPQIVRIHEAGEFTTEKEIAAFCEFTARHAETIFFGYTKDERVQEMQRAQTLPQNVHFACSPWILEDGTVLCAPVGDVYQYIYNDGTNRAHDVITRCPCSNPDGTTNKDITCLQCGRCPRCKDGEKTTVYPHGVALANTWLAGRARLYMKECGLDYTQAATEAYADALRLSRKIWSEKAAAEIESRVAKLAKALKAADKKAAKA